MVSMSCARGAALPSHPTDCRAPLHTLQTVWPDVLAPSAQFQDVVRLQELLVGDGNASGYGPFVPSKGAPVPTYAINLNSSGALPEPVWCVPQQSLGSACSTAGRFGGEISS